MKPYYYVYRYGYGMPTARHKTLKEAQAEAERLAKKHQGFPFEILEFKGLSSLHESITFWVDGVDPDDDEYVSDGHGNEWVRCGPYCDMEVVRPGKVQCSCQEQYVELELTNEPQAKQVWETFCDESYYDMWRVRRKTDRGWEDGFHLNKKLEAESLCNLLNQLEDKIIHSKL
jgi:hypothetical protein